MEQDKQELNPTPASAWKGKVAVEGTDLMLPSDNVARVRQISPQAFITSGLIPDPLTSIVRQAIHTKQGLPPSKLEAMVTDPDKLRSTMEMFDRVLCYVVIEPHCEMPPVCVDCGEYNTDDSHGLDTHEYQEGPRDDDILYADTVDFNDKVFIFQWCLGGTRDLEAFRKQQRASLESVSNGKGVRSPAKRPARRK